MQDSDAKEEKILSSKRSGFNGVFKYYVLACCEEVNENRLILSRKMTSNLYHSIRSGG